MRNIYVIIGLLLIATNLTAQSGIDGVTPLPILSPERSSCSDILKFGRRTLQSNVSTLSLLYDQKIGINNRIVDVGGSGNIILPNGVPVGGTFNGLVKKAKFDQAEKLSLEKFDQYIFRNELGPGIAAAWLECMKLRSSGNFPMIDLVGKEKLIKLQYGDANTIPLTILSYQKTTGLELKGEIPKAFSGKRTIAIARKKGTNKTEGIIFSCQANSGEIYELKVYWPPKIPKLIWFEEEISVSVPTGRKKDFDFTIPKIPDGTEATAYAIYQGGSPADRARVNLVGAVHFDDDTGKNLPELSMKWQQGAPNTHISPSKKSKTLPPGKYRVHGTSIVERNGNYRGGSLLKILVVTKIDPKLLEPTWEDKPTIYSKAKKVRIKTK